MRTRLGDPDQENGDAELDAAGRRGHSAAGDSVGELPRRQREDRQRKELSEPDEPEVERPVPDRIDLPADRYDHHLPREAVGQQRRPEQRESPHAQGWRQALPHERER